MYAQEAIDAVHVGLSNVIMYALRDTNRDPKALEVHLSQISFPYAFQAAVNAYRDAHTAEKIQRRELVRESDEENTFGTMDDFFWDGLEPEEIMMLPVKTAEDQFRYELAWNELTDKEKQVMSLVLKGVSRKEIMKDFHPTLTRANMDQIISRSAKKMSMREEGIIREKVGVLKETKYGKLDPQGRPNRGKKS